MIKSVLTLHELGLQHYDIKPYLNDFDSESEPGKFSGIYTKEFLAPELQIENRDESLEKYRVSLGINF